ncbi:MAG: potassium transporter TrkG [bacterium]
MKIFNKLTLLTAAEATVISFFAAAVIGGSLLYITERNRAVEVKVPVVRNVAVIPAGMDLQAYEDAHTFALSETRKGESFIDTLFTSVSALCVTGLTSTDFSKFTFPGQFIVLILIQMGGLGIIVFTSIFAYAIVKGFSERNSFKKMLAGILDTEHHDVSRMIGHIVLYTVLFEGLGFLIMGAYLSFSKSASTGGINPWWWSLFHSVSAFNNAGFSLMVNNLENFVMNPIINFTIAALVILGGLGYPVLIAIHTALYKKLTKRHGKELGELKHDAEGVMASRVQMRIAIYGTISLLAAGTIVPLLIEWHNPVFSGRAFLERLTIVFFHSASARTAGFNTINIGSFGAASLVFICILMFIGANPAGTAGGIKIPTMAVLYGYIKDWFQKPGEPVKIFGRRVSKFAVSHAIRLFFSSIIFLSIIVFLINVKEYNYLITTDTTFNFTKVVFETFSAFGTVGLSMGFAGAKTSFAGILSSFSKSLLIITMLVGRLGPLTVLSALPWKRRYSEMQSSPDYDDVEKIQIG